MGLTKKDIRLAIRNISRFGDTDIFPNPIENYVFYDKERESIEIIEDTHRRFPEQLIGSPPEFVKSLSVIGYHGFRSPTQIDPIWNAYLLSLVISIAKELEDARVPIRKNIVFSYRFKPNERTGSLFDRDIGWKAYQEIAVLLTKKYSFVLSTDISDFYPRIYHHRLKNALARATTDGNAVHRIMEILNSLSGNVSYGLPVGGPAARILSETLLGSVDKLLVLEGIVFCRFVDDITVFAHSREEAHANFVRLSQILLQDEGLSLQRSKTRIISSEEFLETSLYAQENKAESKEEDEARKFVRLRLRYDPYSPTAEDDYEALKNEIMKFDVVGLLGREIVKGRIDESLTRQLIRATKFLSRKIRNDTILSLMSNLSILYPVFPTVMLLVRASLSDLKVDVRREVFGTIRSLIQDNSYITQVPVNLLFALRVLAHDTSEETDIVLAQLYKKPVDMMVKRDIILGMAKRNTHSWISHHRKHYGTVTSWEKRALLIASYCLDDEGSHWRDKVKSGLSAFDRLCLKWAASKKSSGRLEIPL